MRGNPQCGPGVVRCGGEGRFWRMAVVERDHRDVRSLAQISAEGIVRMAARASRRRGSRQRSDADPPIRADRGGKELPAAPG